MSEQQTEKPSKAPAWWVKIVFAAFVAWIFNNLITVATFVGTGVVQLSHVGVVPFLLALGLSVACSAIGIVIGIRLCTYLVFNLIAAAIDSFRSIDWSKAMSTSEKRSTAPADLTALFSSPPPVPPPSRWELVRSAVEQALGAALIWLLVPKRFRSLK